MRFRYFAAVSAGVTLTCCVFAADSNRVKSPAARAALKKYDSAIAKADEAREVAARSARKTATEELTIALKNATRAADLDDADKIRDAIAEIAAQTQRSPAARAMKSPSGTWHLVFATGEEREYRFRPDGTVTWTDKIGKVVIKNDEVLIDDGDGAIDRWTAAGDRAFVEHFHPASSFGKGHARQMAVATTGKVKAE